jgi:hypothetical protein
MNVLNSDDLLKLKEDGYFIIKDFYNINEINKMRKLIIFNAFIKGNLLYIGDKGGSKPDFLNDPDYNGLMSLLRLNDIHHIMKQIFKAPFHLCFHNDIGINRIVNWHKDTLNNQYKIYQKNNIWESLDGEKHEIYKFLIYLQDHSNNMDGLTLIEKSHLNPQIIINGEQKYIKSKIGDIIIFDQRITHRGQQYNSNYKIDRILISIGFGKNNIFTKEFEEGTQKRQNDQNRLIKKKF